MPAESTLPPATADGSPRIEWIDIARGIGIVLVVYGHAIRGQISAHLYPASAAIKLQDALIYSFHMPLFFFLSGLFIGKKSAANVQFFKSRMLLIAYPYIIWSIIQSILNIFAKDLVNSPIESVQILQILWIPIGQFWFLYALLICQLLLILPRYVFYALVPIGIVLTTFLGIGNMPLRALGELPYFAAGVWLTIPQLEGLLRSRRRRIALILAAALAFFLLFLLALKLDQGVAAHLVAIPLAAAGIVGTLAAARQLAPVGHLLRVVGSASMPIFLMHVIAGAAVRISLSKLIQIPPLLLLLIVTAAGIILPYLFFLWADRMGLSPWLGFGRSSRHTAHRSGAGPSPLEPASPNADVEPTRAPKDINFP